MNTSDAIDESWIIIIIVFSSKVLAPELRRDGANRVMWSLLEFSGFHSDGDADEDNAEHGNGGVALPVLGTAVRATAHTPDLVPEIAVSVSMAVIAAATSHFFRFRFLPIGI